MIVTRLRTGVLATLAMLVTTAGAQSASAQGKDKRLDSATASAVARKSGEKGVYAGRADARSSDVEIRIIRDYFSGQSKKPKRLPPGIAKNLARGKPLPPGIAKTRMPDDLLRRLPKRNGMRWVLVGDRVLLVDVGGVVVDIVRAML